MNTFSLRGCKCLMMWHIVQPLIVSVATAFLLVAQAIASEEAINLAFARLPDASLETLIRWPRKPDVWIIVTSAISEKEQESALRVSSSIREQCACIDEIHLLEASHAKSIIGQADGIVLTIDKNGYLRTQSELHEVLTHVFAKAPSMRMSLPRSLANPALEFRYLTNGSNVLFSFSAASVDDKSASLRSIIYHSLLISAAPTISSYSPIEIGFLEKKSQPDGREFLLSRRGYEFLQILYDDRLSPGMSMSDVKTILGIN